MVEEVMAVNGKLSEKALAGHARSMARLRGILIDHSLKRIDVEQAENALSAKVAKLKATRTR